MKLDISEICWRLVPQLSLHVQVSDGVKKLEECLGGAIDVDTVQTYTQTSWLPWGNFKHKEVFCLEKSEGEEVNQR